MGIAAMFRDDSTDGSMATHITTLKVRPLATSINLAPAALNVAPVAAPAAASPSAHPAPAVPMEVSSVSSVSPSPAPAAETTDESPMLQVMKSARTADELNAALQELGVVMTYNSDVADYVTCVLAKHPINLTIHDGYISFIHPLTGKEVKLLTHKNTVRSAPARVRTALAAVAKTEGEIGALLIRRAQECISAIMYEFAARAYDDYESGERAIAGQEASFKVDLALEKREIDRLERKKARKAAKRAKKEVERALREKVGGKRRAVVEDSEDSSSEEEDADDRAFVAPERRPRKEPRADNVETPYITVTLKVPGAEGDEYAVPRHSTVLSLKQLFCEGMEGLTPADVRFVYGGQPMPDNQTLHQNQVGEGARIHVLRENHGGGATKEDAAAPVPSVCVLCQAALPEERGLPPYPLASNIVGPGCCVQCYRTRVRPANIAAGEPTWICAICQEASVGFGNTLALEEPPARSCYACHYTRSQQAFAMIERERQRERERRALEVAAEPVEQEGHMVVVAIDGTSGNVLGPVFFMHISQVAMQIAAVVAMFPDGPWSRFQRRAPGAARTLPARRIGPMDTFERAGFEHNDELVLFR